MKTQELWGVSLDACQTHLEDIKGAFETVEKNVQIRKRRLNTVNGMWSN